MGSDPVSQAAPDSPLDRNAFKVMLVEDEPLLAELLQRCLSSEPVIEILATTGNGESAVNLSRDLKPDAVIMDIELEGEMNGIEAANRIKAERGDTGVVILSTHKSRRYIESQPLHESSGWSYLLKQSVPNISTLVRAIRGSIDGMLVLDPEVVKGLPPKPDSAVQRLTPRLIEVLKLIAQGYSYLVNTSVNTAGSAVNRFESRPGEIVPNSGGPKRTKDRTFEITVPLKQ